MDWIYKHNDDNTARFILGTVGENSLVCFGINPSTAEPDKLDPTLIRIQKYADINGFDSWVMLNIYPQRATNPNHIHLTVDNDLHEQNILHISKILQRKNLTLLATWGVIIAMRTYFKKCLLDIAEIADKNECRWVALGKTKDGHPYHPLTRAKGFKLYNTPLTDFNIREYLQNEGGKHDVINKGRTYSKPRGGFRNKFCKLLCCRIRSITIS